MAVTALLAVTWFTVGALRVTNSGGDVVSAARAGARAAATARSGSEHSAAHAVAAAALADRGVACAGGPAVTVTPGVTSAGGTEPVRTMTVSVTCAVQLDDVALAFRSPSRIVSASATELVDPLRGGQG
ncbi:MAG TPA: hypothetical protein VNQ73_15395 [Ilumatobacter sp.]|nr:hypothetical protein [Ilumatobacter sp.]